MRVLVSVLLCAVMGGGAWGQPGGGSASISGYAHDLSGVGLPDTRVEVSNPLLGIRRVVESTQTGMFSVPALPPGDGYVATITKTGYVSLQARFDLLVGQDVHIDAELEPVPTSAIEVIDIMPVAEATKSGFSQVIQRRQIMTLPINGRRVDTFVLLTPGVAPDGVQGLVAFRGVPGGNTFVTDGNDTSNQFFHENAGRTRIPTQISQDAVQEFQVLTNRYSAEYGRASAGIINTLTRSGTNELHGTMYWFFRNRSFNARDPHSSVNPPEERHQAGASVSGKITKDNLFYFFNLEAQRRSFPLTASLSRPPLFDAGGRFVGSCQATVAQCTRALQFLDRQFGVLDRTADTELGFGKLDWRPSPRHSLSASFNYVRWISPNGWQTDAVLNNGEGVGSNADASVRVRYGRLAWTAMPGGGIANEFRFGWMKDRHSDSLNDNLIPAQTGLVQITVAGQENLGVGAQFPRLFPSENRFQFADNVTKTAGSHIVKFGVDLVSTQDFLRFLQNRNGTYEYADFTSFAQDFSGNPLGLKRWQRYSQRFGHDMADITTRDYSFYAQDQFRPAVNLTLNYGLRYEYARLPQPARTNPAYPEAARIPATKGNFGPRVGFAVAFNRSRTVVRGGYGIFHSRYQSGAIHTFLAGNGYTQQSVSLERRFLADIAFGPIFPSSLGNDLIPVPPTGPASPNFMSTVDLTLPSSGFRNAYAQQADFGLEHEVTPNLVLAFSYLWNRALHLTSVRDGNIGPAGSPTTYRIRDAAGNEIGTYTTPTYRLSNRVDPRWRRVNIVESNGNVYYNGLVVQLRKRLTGGVEGTASYTWSHAIDFNQGGSKDNILFSEGPPTLLNGDYRGERGSSQLDQRHRLVVTTILSPTFTRRNGRLARYLINDWLLTQISTFSSAQPATPEVLVVGVPFPGAAFNTTLNGLGGSTRVPFWPRSSLDIDQMARTDVRLTKVLAADRYRVAISFQAINVFNHPHNTSVSTVAFQAQSAVLTPVPRLGEGTASQGYPDGTNARRAQIHVRLLW